MKTLTPKNLADEWVKKQTRPVYYLSGEETALKETAVKRLETIFKPETFNFSVRDAETSDIADALGEARTSPMLADIRFVVIKRAEKLKKEPMRRLLEYLADPCPGACLLLLGNYPREKVDPIAPALGADSALVDFSPMNVEQAEAYLNARLLAGGVKTDQKALEVLVDMMGTGSVTLDSEAEKIILFMNDQDRMFEPQDALALAGFARTQNPYELSNAMRARNPAAAAAAALQLLAAGEEPLALLSQTSRAVEHMLKAKRISASGEGPGACYQAGMSPGQYHHALRDSAAFTEDKLLRSLRRCLEAEELLKSSSKRDPGLMIRQLIFEITSGK
ncbi:MAG TPA: DNA polymerase III subunit delta [Elusimicrobiales bacterium]|nr:DNA polymerase III subunit delta [Elusimicrobiales bacterium]